MPYRSYKDLEVWRMSKDIAVQVIRASADWRVFGLRDQMVRSSVSIPSNIAEGSERRTPADRRQFYTIALGSCAELNTQLIIAHETGLVGTADFERLHADLNSVGAMLHGLIRSLDA